MSSSGLSLATLKNACPPAQSPSPSQSQSSSILGSDHHTQKRVGGPGSFGAGAASRSSPSSARNNQSLRKQHKGQRRPRLADEDAAAESAAMQSTSSRKGRTSITHLMNFTLPPRPQNYHPHHFGRNARRNPSWGLGSGYHAADKAKYVHANYRFVVTPQGDYRAQAIDADVHLDWTNVLQILVSAQSQAANCPICLSTPVAPRMAKCGHIFCLPCLIRYMHSSDDVNPNPEKRARWKKCPICWDSIYISETRPVRWFTGQERERPQEGGDVVLRLIMRQPGSTLALPRNGAEAVEIPDEIPWYLAAEVMDYARVMKGSEEYMTEQYGAEIEELLQQEKEDELMFGDETIWTKKAVASIRDAKERVKGIGSPPKAPQQPSERKARWPTIEHRGGAEDVPEFYHIQHASKSGHCLDRIATKIDSSSSESSLDQMTCGNSTSPSDASSFRTTASTATNAKPEPSVQCWAAHSTQQSISRHRERSSAGGNPDSPFFFYEALLHYYLSPLDIRILKAAFGNFSSFPTTILPRVEHVSTGRIVDDELRRRARYLAHLPAGCEVGFLECDWTDVVPPEVLATFTAEIERRRKKNFEKETREEKERVRAEREEDDKRWAAARRRRPTPAQEVISETDFQPLNENSTVDFAASSPPWSSQGMQGGVGFESLASPSTSPSTARTVWGTRIVVPSSPHLPAAQDEDDVPGDDGWLQNWEQDLLREENLVAQVEATSLNASSSKQGAPTGNGKKKKGKRITLMSTNVRRGT